MRHPNRRSWRLTAAVQMVIVIRQMKAGARVVAAVGAVALALKHTTIKWIA